jgi:hypothetical protein
MIRAGDKALAFAAVIKIYIPPDEHAYFFVESNHL